MTTSETLGVLGFCVACLGLIFTVLHIVWQVWWQHHQNRERVRALFLMDPEPHVRVHNIGVVPVFVRAVELVSGGKSYPFLSVVSHQALPTESGVVGRAVWQSLGTTTYPDPLERGDAYNFILATKALPAVAGGEYISVSSHAGELCRVTGKQVSDFLAAATTPAANRT
jgi:hypothetical protein